MRIRALQSGTSADGIDHVTASFTPHGDVLHVRVEDHGTAPMPADLGGPLARALGGDALTGEEWRARPVVEWLSEATTRELAAAPAGPGRIIVVADRLDDDQRAVIAAAQAQGAAVVVNVGPIGATAPHPTVELGADSPLSVRVLQEWLGGAVR